MSGYHFITAAFATGAICSVAWIVGIRGEDHELDLLKRSAAIAKCQSSKDSVVNLSNLVVEMVVSRLHNPRHLIEEGRHGADAGLQVCSGDISST